MTIVELKEHCERAIDPTNKLAFDVNSKTYQEHKLVLDLILEHEQRADEREKVFKIIESRLNDNTTITFDLPVEEILGDDIDMDDFLMLAEEIVQQYKSLIFAKLREAKEQSNE